MAKQSNIGWTDATQNFWEGCIKVSAGCKMCYMYRDMKRFGKNPALVRRVSDKTFYAPLKWKEPLIIFTCSYSDFFIKEADGWRADAWEVMRKTPQHLWLILTKRIERFYQIGIEHFFNDLPKNIMIGISAENNSELQSRWPVLENYARSHNFKTFISLEPLLEELTELSFDIMTDGKFAGAEHKYPDWVITGGESDFVKPRLVNINAFRKIRDWCIENSVPYFHKQHGGIKKINGIWGGNEIDGMTWEQFPALQHPAITKKKYREYPIKLFD